MSLSIGRLTAHLAEPLSNDRLDVLVQKINDNITPPGPLNCNSVHIRAMYIVSEDVNSFGGRFPAEEHARLAELMIDSPVMVGHRKDRLPIARTFFAEPVVRDGKKWVKSYFYWLRSADGAETLRENIDGGIYRECSISFTFLLPECSICRRDIRTCRHQPFETYTVDGAESVCHYNYRRIERVLESSLVYRGAVAGTAVTKDLTEPAAGSRAGYQEIPIESPTELPPDQEFIVAPAYDGIPVRVEYDGVQLTLVRLDGKDLPDDMAAQFGTEGMRPFEATTGQIVGLRGKERCALSEVAAFLAREKSRVNRVELRLLMSDEPLESTAGRTEGTFAIRPIRHRLADIAAIDSVAQEIKTRDGVTIQAAGHQDQSVTVYRYNPPVTERAEGHFSLITMGASGAARLSFTSADVAVHFVIGQFSLCRLIHGGKFLADRLSGCGAGSLLPGDRVSGQITDFRQEGEAYALQLAGQLSGRLMVRPVKLDGRFRWVMYLLNE